MGYTLSPGIISDGTSLQGYVTTTLDTLIGTFGEPERFGAEDKVTVEFTILFDNGTVATIYDWKRYEDGTPSLDEVYEYHVGGHNLEAVALVKQALHPNFSFS